MKLLGLFLIALLASAAISPVGAGAATSRLILTENEAVVAAGAPAASYYLTFDGGCLQESDGTVLSNDKATDRLAFGAPVESECLEEGFAVAGGVSQVLLKSSGLATLKFKPKLAITEPGPCLYEFSKLTGEFPATIEVDIEGTGEGKLKARLSSPSCEKSRSISFDAVESGVDNDIFGAELSS
jgi:hypothetical protein